MTLSLPILFRSLHLLPHLARSSNHKPLQILLRQPHHRLPFCRPAGLWPPRLPGPPLLHKQRRHAPHQLRLVPRPRHRLHLRSLVLHDPHMSTCDSIVLGRPGNGFSVEPWRAPHLSPSPDNLFMLLGCSSESPLFQGFPGKHMPCRNISGLGCDEYYYCPAWDIISPRRAGPVYGSGPPDCCSMPFESVKSVNLSRLDCQ